MTPEELNLMIADVLNPAKSPEAVNILTEKITGLVTEIETAKAEKDRLNKEIDSMTAMNASLRLLVTGVRDDEPHPEEKDIEDMDRNELREFFSNKMKEAMNNAQSQSSIPATHQH